MQHLLRKDIFCIIAICLGVINLFGCMQEPTSGSWKLKGEILSYTDTVFFAKEVFGKLTKDKMMMVLKHFVDDQNRDTLLIQYDPTGKEESRTIFTYNNDGRVVKEVEFSSKEKDNDFWGKSLDKTTRTTIHTYLLEKGKLREQKIITYEERYFEGIDSTDIYNESYVKKTEYDTLRYVILYKYKIPQKIVYPKNEATEIYYMNNNNDVAISARIYTSTYFTYNNKGLQIGVKYKNKNEQYFGENSIEYEFDNKGNPIILRSYDIDENKTKKPNLIQVRHYEYK